MQGQDEVERMRALLDRVGVRRKTRGRKEARETEEGTTDDEMIRACEAAEEQAAAEAVTEGNGANAKDGTEADELTTCEVT